MQVHITLPGHSNKCKKRNVLVDTFDLRISIKICTSYLVRNLESEYLLKSKKKRWLGLPEKPLEVSIVTVSCECAYFFLCAGRNTLQGNKFQFMKNPRTGANIKAIKDIQEIGPICSHHTAKHASCFCP